MFKRRPKQPERRPLPVSRPADVFSYHASRSSQGANLGRYNPQVTSRTKKRFSWTSLPVWLSLGVILIALGYASTLTASPRVTVIADKGSVHHKTQDYEAYLSSVLRGSFLNYSKLTINSDSVRQSLQRQFPELTEVTVSIPLVAHRPVIKVVAAKPIMLLQAANGSFYIDDQGRALANITDISAPEGEIVTVADQSGLKIEVGKQILPNATVSFIQEVTRQLSAKGLKVTQFVLPAAPEEIQARIEGYPYYVRFNSAADPIQQAGTYLALKSKLDSEGIAPREYIDLRVDERAYYK